MIDFETLSIFTLVLIFLSILLAGFVHGALGFGFPLTVTPLLALILDLQSAIFITLIPTIALNIVSITLNGRITKDVWKYFPLYIFIFLGSIIGSKLLIIFEADTFKLLLAFMIFFYLYTQKNKLNIFKWIKKKQKTAMVSFGLASGFTSGAVSVMVPILVIYAFEIGLVGSALMIQVMNIAFLIGKSTQFAVFAIEGIITTQFLIYSILPTLFAVFSLLLGMKVRKNIDENTYKAIVLKVLFLIAIIMCVEYFI